VNKAAPNPIEQDNDAAASAEPAAKPAAATKDRPTPMMEQYLTIKADHPDALLFYRMGDFFELFFDDAVQAAEALDITLTKRGKHQGDDISMCGVPAHSHVVYLERLIRKGFKVAICEQVEDPAEAKRKRGHKAVVKREVTRIVTPGTLTEDTLLDARSNNYLLSVATAKGQFGVAWMDVSIGTLHTQACDEAELATIFSRLAPGEILISETVAARDGLTDVVSDWRDCMTVEPASRFDSDNARRRLEQIFGVGTLDSFGNFCRAEVAAAGSLITYVELTQKGALPRIAPPRQYLPGSVMEIDAATRRNLELTSTLTGERKGSVLSVIDRTLTGPGARLLLARLNTPLTDRAIIDERLDAIQFFMDAERVRGDVREQLRGLADMERALSRLSIGRGGPRDLAAVCHVLNHTATIRTIVSAETGMPGAIATNLQGLDPHVSLVDRLASALAEDLPVYVRDGGFIKPGYAPGLDELRGLRDESKRLIANLQARYQEETSVAQLKVCHNNVLGYFVEVPAKQGDKIIADKEGPFIHRQTMANAVRFTTTELSELEGRIAQAADKAQALESELFDSLREDVLGFATTLADVARGLSQMDVSASLAELAVQSRYCRPVLNDDRDLHIVGGRHPVVEAALVQSGDGQFVANDTDLADGARIWLLTGPNMAGKSTFLRQNALIALLAQMGSFVPATEARIGIVDRLFSRVGAADDLARGRSTFMVEMVETAAILNQAGPKSLVILDEIGRGTATFDGLSIAWAVVEQLHEENRCRALFATHYHELTALSARLADLSCFSMRVKEWQGDVIFLHQVGAGAADRSYGIHVGRLAGLPPAVITYAEQILATLEQGEQSSKLTQLADDLPLFATVTEDVKSGGSAKTALEPALIELDRVNADDLTPREALEFLYMLKSMRLNPDK
jgi:DNA mismatch repair protein MutS